MRQEGVEGEGKLWCTQGSQPSSPVGSSLYLKKKKNEQLPWLVWLSG